MSKEENLFQERRQRSIQNRQNPMAFVQDYFHGYYYDNSFNEFIAFFKRHVEANTLIADDFLFCLNEIINHPPNDLIDRLYQVGVMFYHNDKNETDWEFDEYLNWLKKLHELLNAIYENPKFDYQNDPVYIEIMKLHNT